MKQFPYLPRWKPKGLADIFLKPLSLFDWIFFHAFSCGHERHLSCVKESVVFSVHPPSFIEVFPSAVQSQATCGTVHGRFVGFCVRVGGEAGLVQVPFSVGGVGLIKVSLHRVTSRPCFRIVEVAPSASALIAQPIPINAAPIILALGCTATQAPVVKLSVTRTPVVDLPFAQAAQAGVLEGATSPEGEVIQVKVEEAAVGTGQGGEAAFWVPSPEVVVVPRGGVGRGAQEGGVFGVRASRHQVVVILGADDVVDVGRAGAVTGACFWGAHFQFVLFLPAVVRRDAQITTLSQKYRGVHGPSQQRFVAEACGCCCSPGWEPYRLKSIL